MRKNSNFKLIGGLIAGILIGSATIVGANQAIQAIQNTEIKVSLNGQVQEFKDETTGEVQYPITYHNRTYLPLRNVAQLSGLKVDYDSTTNTARLNGIDSNVMNTLDYDSMVNELVSYVYGGNGSGPYEKVSRDGSTFDGVSTRTFIIDIDNNETPEIIEFGDKPIGDINFQVYTMNNNEVITVSHKANLLNNTFIIYVTESGVYAYENQSDGPIDEKVIVKLELRGMQLSCKEVLRHIIEGNQNDNDKDGKNSESFYVDGNKCDKDTYIKKIDELNKMKIYQKKVYRDTANVKNVEYENLWAYEMFLDAKINNTIKVGNTYFYNEKAANEVHQGWYGVLDSSKDDLEYGEKITILNEYKEEFEGPEGHGWFIDYDIQRENGEVVKIGQRAGRT